MAVIFCVGGPILSASHPVLSAISIVYGRAELVPITIPQGTFARLSNLIAGGCSILNRLERAGGAGSAPKCLANAHGVEANQRWLFHEVPTLSPQIAPGAFV